MSDDTVADQDGWTVHDSVGDHSFVGTTVVVERREDGELVEREGVIDAIWEFPGRRAHCPARRRRARGERGDQHGGRPGQLRLTSVGRTARAGHTFKTIPAEADRQHAQLLNERLEKRDDPRGQSWQTTPSRLTTCFFGPDYKRCSLSGDATVRAGAVTRRDAHTTETDEHPTPTTASRTARTGGYRTGRAARSRRTSVAALPTGRNDPQRTSPHRHRSLRVPDVSPRPPHLGGLPGMSESRFFSERVLRRSVSRSEAGPKRMEITAWRADATSDGRGGGGGCPHHTTTVSCRIDNNVSALPTRSCRADNCPRGGGRHE